MYLVRIKNNWFPAYRDNSASGGWSNHDTWQDFHKEVTDFRRIDMPITPYGGRGWPPPGEHNDPPIWYLVALTLLAVGLWAFFLFLVFNL